jgi:hypothetical protein
MAMMMLCMLQYEQKWFSRYQEINILKTPEFMKDTLNFRFSQNLPLIQKKLVPKMFQPIT